MAAFNKLSFKDGEDGGVVIELSDGHACVTYVFKDPDETFNTLQIVAQCMEDDMKANGIEFDDGYSIECSGACDNIMEKFSEPQFRAIIKVLYEHDLPSDLDVLATEIQMRIH